MNIKLVFLAMSIVVGSTYMQLCQTPSTQIPLFITPSQVLQIPLSPYIKGYDLQYTTTSQAQLVPPFNTLHSGKSQFPAGTSLLGMDVPEENKNKGILAGQNGQTIIISYANFDRSSLPQIYTSRSYVLPSKATCSSVQALNENLDVVVDCITEEMVHYVCMIIDFQITCTQLESLFEDQTQYTSKIITSGQEKFLISAVMNAQNEDYLMVYNLMNGAPQFNLIIDRQTFKMDFLNLGGLAIIPRALTNTAYQYLEVTDRSGIIIKFAYLPSNKVIDVSKWVLQQEVSTIFVNSQGNSLVSTQNAILQYDSEFMMVGNYNLEEDVTVKDIQTSSTAVIVVTQTELYTYARNNPSYKYLLKRQLFLNGLKVLSFPQTKNFLLLSENAIKLIRVGQGYLLSGQMTKDGKIELTADSQGLSCKVTFKIKLVNSTDKIYKKNSNNNLHFQSSIALDLTDEFGGNYLSYNISLNNDKFKYQFQQISNYSVAPVEGASIFTIIPIDSQAFYRVSIVGTNLLVDACTYWAGCQNIKTQSNILGNVVALDGRKTDHGYLIVWAYEKNKFQLLTKSYRETVLYQTNYDYDNVLVGEQLILFTQKQQNTLLIFANDHLTSIDKNYFSQEELEVLGGGFYPRQVYLHPTHPNMFYLKLPISIALMSFQGRKLSIVSFWKVSQEFIPDEKWSLVIGNHDNFLIVLPSTVNHYLLQENLTLLYSIPIGNVSFPVQYSQSLDMAFIQADENIHVIRVNQPKLNTQYMKMPYTGKDWKIAEGMLYFSSGKIYLLNDRPLLKIQSSQSSLTASSQLTLQVTAPNTTKTKVSSTLTNIYYPTAISPKQSNSLLNLPETATSQRIYLNIYNYFNGSIAKVDIVCPYCIYGDIRLINPLDQPIMSDVPKAKQIISSLNGALVLASNILYIVNDMNKILTTYEIETYSSCEKMTNYNMNIVVYCVGAGKQEIVLLKITSSIQKVNDFILPRHVGVEDMKLSSQGLLSIFDGNQVHFFSIGDVQMNYVYSIGGYTFSLTDKINSIDQEDNQIFLAIGGKGIAHYNVKQRRGTFIDLKKDQAIKDSTLDDAQFMLIQALKVTATNWSVFVGTSNSLHFVVSINAITNALSVVEMYNRYGDKATLNWFQISQKYLMIGYSGNVLALYKRTTNGMGSFFYATDLTFSSASLTDTYFYTSDEYGLQSYNIHGYGLQLNYEQRGNFDKITVSASNSYSLQSSKIMVHFDGGDESSGVKWYIILIIILVALIVIGVIVGMYQKLKKKKQSAESLVTEEEQLDEQV